MIAERLTAQMLSGPPARDPVSVVERLLAVQAQDPRGARLAIRARSAGLTAADVDRALTEDRSLLISWLNRGTLHLVRREDFPWLHALTTPQLATGNARRLDQEGVSLDEADRGVRVIEQALAAEGPLTREQLRDHLGAAGVRTDGQALVHILLRATLHGLIVRGPMVGTHQAFVLIRDWLGEAGLPPPAAFDRDRALAELARRYLAGHGPADHRDLARWANITLGDAHRGLNAIAAELRERDDGLVELRSHPRPAALPPPRLLGAFEPVLLGWVSRTPLVGEHHELVTVNGVFRPFAMAGGRAVATWGLPGGRVELKPLVPISAADRAALDADAGDVLRFLSSGPSVPSTPSRPDRD